MGDVVRCPECGAKNRMPATASGRPRCAKCSADLPWVVAAGDADLKSALNTPLLVLIDLWAPWCGPCRTVAPVLERLATRYAGQVKVVKVNVDEAPRTARRFQAFSIPTLVLVDHGEEVDRVVGALPERKFAAVVERALRARPPAQGTARS